MLTCRTTGLCVASSDAGSLPWTRPRYAASGKEGRRKSGYIAHGFRSESAGQILVQKAKKTGLPRFRIRIRPDQTFTIKNFTFGTKKDSYYSLELCVILRDHLALLDGKLKYLQYLHSRGVGRYEDFLMKNENFYSKLCLFFCFYFSKKDGF